ncbi:MAG: peptide-methionine (S)-S-oxide reductase MsrA [Candidatus Vogelbacteria bacterium]|nr:peptide-methionine (S)-S-oxide reductase MsrA [Candidatus Vogelbacteria bacterium]
MAENKTEIAVFGCGCFWCTEAVFKMLKGVKSVASGYAGGSTANPTYENLGDHAEVIKIEYDSAQIKFDDLLTVFFATHDPTTKNRQGNDIGPQYRSIILYTTKAQKEASAKLIEELEAVTALKPLAKFYPAEDYHQNYYARHPGNPYCEVVINPKLEKVQTKFAKLLNDNEK